MKISVVHATRVEDALFDEGVEILSGENLGKPAKHIDIIGIGEILSGVVFERHQCHLLHVLSESDTVECVVPGNPFLFENPVENPIVADAGSVGDEVAYGDITFGRACRVFACLTVIRH